MILKTLAELHREHPFVAGDIVFSHNKRINGGYYEKGIPLTIKDFGGMLIACWPHDDGKQPVLSSKVPRYSRPFSHKDIKMEDFL